MLNGAADQALHANGMSGERLMAMAYAVANSYCSRTGSSLGLRLDDLAQHLALTASRRALLYDPSKNPNSSFASYIWDIMEPACIDWHRRKGEGFADRRYWPEGNPVTLTDRMEDTASDELEDVVHAEPPFSWRYAAWLIKQPFSSWPVVHERRILRWQRAADRADLTLDEFIVRAIDVYAQSIELRAA